MTPPWWNEVEGVGHGGDVARVDRLQAIDQSENGIQAVFVLRQIGGI